MAKGVQGRIDLTVPEGGASEIAFGFDFVGNGSGRWEAGGGRSVTGLMNRILFGSA